MEQARAIENPFSLQDFVRAAKSQIRELNPADAQQMLEERDDVLVLDVREASEYEQGHVPNALLVPRGILEAAADPSYPKHVETLCQARQRPVVVYCATGGRSAMASVTLQLMGFENVYSLAGGITQWQEEQRPVVHEACYV